MFFKRKIPSDLNGHVLLAVINNSLNRSVCKSWLRWNICLGQGRLSSYFCFAFYLFLPFSSSLTASLIEACDSMSLGLNVLFGSQGPCEMCGPCLLCLAGCRSSLEGTFCVCTFNPLTNSKFIILRAWNLRPGMDQKALGSLLWSWWHTVSPFLVAW